MLAVLVVCASWGRFIWYMTPSVDDLAILAIEMVDVDGVAVLEAKDDASVGAHRHSPAAGGASLQRVKPKPRVVHVVRAHGRVEPGEDVADSAAVLRTDPPFFAAFHEPPERPAPEAAYHVGP